MFAPNATVILDCDDTVYKKTGRKVNGTGTFRDAVRSTRARVVYAWGLNLVIITLRVTPPWGGCPLGLPINMRVHHKGAATTVELAAQMIREIIDWLPGRDLRLHADGAYATLVGADLPRTVVTSRLRRDAALYELRGVRAIEPPTVPIPGNPGGRRCPDCILLADAVRRQPVEEDEPRARRVISAERGSFAEAPPAGPDSRGGERRCPHFSALIPGPVASARRVTQPSTPGSTPTPRRFTRSTTRTPTRAAGCGGNRRDPPTSRTRQPWHTVRVVRPSARQRCPTAINERRPSRCRRTLIRSG